MTVKMVLHALGDGSGVVVTDDPCPRCTHPTTEVRVYSEDSSVARTCSACEWIKWIDPAVPATPEAKQAREWSWDRRTELVSVYDKGVRDFDDFMDDNGWQDPQKRRHEAGLLAVARLASNTEPQNFGADR